MYYQWYQLVLVVNGIIEIVSECYDVWCCTFYVVVQGYCWNWCWQEWCKLYSSVQFRGQDTDL